MAKCKCEWCNSQSIKALGYCGRHYAQLKEFGYVKRTKLDPNEIVLHDDYAEIYLYNAFGELQCSTYVDLDQVDRIKGYKWRLAGNYVINNKVGFLHRFVSKVDDDRMIDHIDRNGLNNRSANLRVCDKKSNAINAGKHVDNTSGHKNVYWNKQKQKWEVKIRRYGKTIHGGLFESKEEAHTRAIELRNEYDGDFICHGEVNNG